MMARPVLRPMIRLNGPPGPAPRSRCAELGGEIGGDLQAGGLGADLALPVMILSNATAPERTPGAGTGAGRAARVPHVADQAGEATAGGVRMTRAERAGPRLEDVPRPLAGQAQTPAQARRPGPPGV